jgi:hypothetical protein
VGHGGIPDDSFLFAWIHQWLDGESPVRPYSEVKLYFEKES